MKQFLLFLCLFFFNHIIAQELTDSLLLHYKFDSDFVDSSGNQFDGENFGATFVADRFGRQDSAVYFNGIDNYILFPNIEELKPELPISFAFWVKYDSLDGEYSYLLSTSYEYNRSSGVYFNTQLSTGKYAVNFGDGTYSFSPQTRRTYITDKIMDIENWNHITVIVKSETDMKIYVNCKDYGGEYVGSGGSLQYSTTPGNLGRGRRNGNAGVNYFKGALDEFRNWNREIALNEVHELCTETEMSNTEFDLSTTYIAPNPVKDVLKIFNDENLNSALIIYNSIGEIVFEGKFVNNQVNVEFLSKGIYLLVYESKKGLQKKKFIKS